MASGERLYLQDTTGIVVDEVVFDCTEYVSEHPGGRSVIENFGGQDCSWQVSRIST